MAKTHFNPLIGEYETAGQGVTVSASTLRESIEKFFQKIFAKKEIKNSECPKSADVTEQK